MFVLDFDFVFESFMPPNTVILMGLITIVAMFGFIPSK